MKDVQRPQQGFTLIEVLVALTLMALVSLISWRGLDAVQQTGERLDERAEETLSIVRALGQIERDVQLHAGADVLPDQISAVPDAASGAAAKSSVRLPAGIAWDPEIGLSLVRSAGDGLWQQLRWHLQEGKLIRTIGAPSYLLPLPAAETGVVVLEDVDTLTVRMWQAGRGWVDPPSAVRNGASANAQAGAGANTPGQGAGSGVTGLEIAVYRQGAAAGKPYRKVVVLP
ncbi:type II secretion system protein J [Pusillimonas sp.]|uniref:PulJ/GspJ family protein n=1 Tax=Pusillimonas sp. TaxID=3040095 RepID=UPI0029B74E18|nr:prepilin-type N-terminal cleavage/methylation domain-containing protein [Pusillimonas sp.]MDX3893231.1 prepilin-type N-terminal cleavage/methylation domain-containing protein [Pusillimonas sp.]